MIAYHCEQTAKVTLLKQLPWQCYIRGWMEKDERGKADRGGYDSWGVVQSCSKMAML